MSKRVKVLTTQDGEWSALFIDGKLIDQDEILGEGDAIRYWVNLAVLHNFTGDDIAFHYMCDADNTECNDSGGLHVENISELEGAY